MIMVLGSAHSWMRLVASSNMDISGASEVPRSRGKLFFFGSPAAVFLLKNRSRPISIDLKPISIGVLSTSDNYVCSTIDQFITKFFRLVVTN